MEVQSSRGSNMSMDSLEASRHKDDDRKSSLETILVPFYENDVLIKVPKHSPKNTYKNEIKNPIKIGKYKYGRDNDFPTNYLVNKDRERKRNPSYLEKFRKQMGSDKSKRFISDVDHRSISPQCGDTARDSISETPNNQDDFYNTEAYNAIFYEKLLNEQIEINERMEKMNTPSPERTIQDQLKFSKEFENLRSVSEVSHSRRPTKRMAPEPPNNVNLGGLGPDVVSVKPRLDRARSLQRYSEKVRLANRIKIYSKKNTQNEAETKQDIVNSYLINKSFKEKAKTSITRFKTEKEEDQQHQHQPSLIPIRTNTDKLNHERKDNNNKDLRAQANKQPKDNYNEPKAEEIYRPSRPKTVTEKLKGKADVVMEKLRAKSGMKTLPVEARMVSLPVGPIEARMMTQDQIDLPPVQINFLVNVGNYQPSSSLRALEEKHRQFQEQLRAMNLHD